MFYKVNSVVIRGINISDGLVEIDVRNGLPSFEIVGLPDKSVQESRERVVSAIKNSGFFFPTQKVIVNLAPANIAKSGVLYDLPIALGILAATKQIRGDVLRDYLIAGELSLNGEIRGIRGVLLMAEYARKLSKKLIIPYTNLNEALNIYEESKGLESLKQSIDFLTGKAKMRPPNANFSSKVEDVDIVDIAKIKGHFKAKRALEIAVAGRHNILFVGTPGSGKSFLAKSARSILPELNKEESVEVTKIYSANGLLPEGEGLINISPFRSPHHTSSMVSVIGGGVNLRAGEISLAHKGILFLDEMPLFDTLTIESLREPMEERMVTISRSSGSLSYPSDFMLIAAMNPCKCGFLGDKTKECTCLSYEIEKYRKKLSGPILDRIDIQIWVDRIQFDELNSENLEETSKVVKQKIVKARDRQKERYKDLRLNSNADIEEKAFEIDEKSRQMMKEYFEKLNLSIRSFYKVVRVARTIADLEGSEKIEIAHLLEAMDLRNLMIS